MKKALAAFLSRAAKLELTSAEHYDQLAGQMAKLQLRDTELLFRDFAGMSRLHYRDIVTLADQRKLDLAEIVSGDCPDLDSIGDPQSLRSPYNAILHGKEIENRVRDYYLQVAASDTDAEVRQVAADFAYEEEKHIDILDEWIAITPRLQS
ncbi:MAG TPA: ferritin family protein [Rhodospirillaceae bacterium]|nr:ferritin family protein [Rhodospirillaceae bacterium]